MIAPDIAIDPRTSIDCTFVGVITIVGGRLLLYKLPDLHTIDCTRVTVCCEFATHVALLVSSDDDLNVAYWCDDCLEYFKRLGADGVPAIRVQ